MGTPFHNISKDMWDVSLESDCLVLEIDRWIWIYFYFRLFSVSTVVGCSLIYSFKLVFILLNWRL